MKTVQLRQDKEADDKVYFQSRIYDLWRVSERSDFESCTFVIEDPELLLLVLRHPKLRKIITIL